MKSFTIGGIHPPEFKQTSTVPIIQARLPRTAIVLLNQHLGKPAIPVVKKGDAVKAGQLIAEADGVVSATIHAPVSGIIKTIEPIPDATGYKHQAILIETSGDEWLDQINRSETLERDCLLNPGEIIKKIANAGIVGMGGAGFPAHVKLMPPEGKRATVLIVNAVECEPYLTADHRLMLEKSEEILVGLTILMKAIQVDKCIIGIEINKMDAIRRLQELAVSYPGITVQPLKVKYPQGGEKQLIEAVIHRQVPSGGLPVDVGAIVQNVATVYAVYEAVQKNKPLVERVITVTGNGIKKPGNFLVRIGTPMSYVLDMAGGLPIDAAKLISGGPMMGKPLTNLDIPVTKCTSGLLVFSHQNTSRKESFACIRCGKCIEVCPMGLEPYLFMTLTQHSEWDKLEKAHIMDCIECGCCTYSCPATRPLLDYLRIGKQTVGNLIHRQTNHSDHGQ